MSACALVEATPTGQRERPASAAAIRMPMWCTLLAQPRTHVTSDLERSRVYAEFCDSVLVLHKVDVWVYFLITTDDLNQTSVSQSLRVPFLRKPFKLNVIVSQNALWTDTLKWTSSSSTSVSLAATKQDTRQLIWSSGNDSYVPSNF